MPIEVKGKAYKTIEEAAQELNVHAKSLRLYIREKLLPAPPSVPVGLIERRYFPDELIKDYKKRLEAYRLAKRAR
jgi:DNA-binding transcriptional MerR regulator